MLYLKIQRRTAVSSDIFSTLHFLLPFFGLSRSHFKYYYSGLVIHHYMKSFGHKNEL